MITGSIRSWKLILVCVLCLAICLDGVDIRAEDTTLAGESDRSIDAAIEVGLERYIGFPSCSATSCHGSPEPAADSKRLDLGHIRRDEFFVWFDNDPHRRAFDTLRSIRSQKIIDALTAIAPQKNSRSARHAIITSCLACHATNGTSFDISAVSKFLDDGNASDASPLLLGGVHCEACHGTAGAWNDTHFQPGRTIEQKQAAGMRATDNLLVRARLCVSCHVGGPGKDVNHDMIAAGHPVLKFELATYHAALPKHWNDAREQSHSDDLELRLWLAGQVASAEASLQLLRARADERSNQPWPEFAEYNCYACHHDLRHPSWRQEDRYRSVTPGMVSWGDWNFGMLLRLSESEYLGANSAERFRASYAKLQRQMVGNIETDARAIEDASSATLSDLEQWIGATRLAEWIDVSTRLPQPAIDQRISRRLEIIDILQAIAGPEGNTIVENWEFGTQVYLGAVAVDEAYRQSEIARVGSRNGAVSQPETHPADQLRPRLHKIRSLLAFPGGFQSPQQLGESEPMQPTSRELIRKELIQILQDMKCREESRRSPQ